MDLFSRVNSGGLSGIEGYLVCVEADVGEGLPVFSMVGFLAGEVREAGDRVRTAIKNSGFRLRPMKVTLNLSPANVKKNGTAFDLPIALAVLGAYGAADLAGQEDSAFVGELGLDGSVKEVRGVLPIADALKACGLRRMFVPAGNVREVLAVGGMEAVAVKSLSQAALFLNRPELIRPAVLKASPEPQSAYSVDFSEVSGQSGLRRATEIAAAGRHNLLYIGPPGSGKSMMARRIPTILPPPAPEERLEMAKIASICGSLPPGAALPATRPFRSPHHSVSPQGLSGGGRVPMPGEISLASRGVLFLDELPEFQRGTLECLRQPMEERRITVSRVQGSCTFPADFMLVAAMNPCPCGYYPDRSRCSCDRLQIRRYLKRISRPLLDRIDVFAEAAPVSYRELSRTGENESSAAIRARVEQARKIQEERFRGRGILFNSEMSGRDLKEFCALTADEEELMERLFTRFGLSARALGRTLRVARTIADLAGSASVGREHLLEAVSCRRIEEAYWGKGGTDEPA